MRSHWRARRLSITPLEFITALQAHRVWMCRWQALDMPEREAGQVTVRRCDNLAACYVFRSRLSTTPTMALCVTLLCEVEAEFDIQVPFEHIAGEANVASDNLLDVGQLIP